jgi:hypothetical protein
VTIDNRAAARAIGAEAFAHARRPAVLSFPLDRGRRRQSLIDPDPASATFPVNRERLVGYREATTVRSRSPSARATPPARQRASPPRC